MHIMRLSKDTYESIFYNNQIMLQTKMKCQRLTGVLIREKIIGSKGGYSCQIKIVRTGWRDLDF